MKKFSLFIVGFFCLSMALLAQNAKQDSASSEPVTDILYGTRAVNIMTLKQVGKKALAYRISHRMGPVNDGAYNFFGLDGPASISLAFDYGITDNLMVGIARNSRNKLYDGFVKYNFLNQTTDNSMPLSLGIYSRASITGLRTDSSKVGGVDKYASFAHRMHYITQIMIGRKFGERLSLQLSPTFIHYNLVDSINYRNNIFALSVLGSFKFGKKLGISAEYTHAFSGAGSKDKYYNSLGVGLDVVTGGHVFQIHLINSIAINDAEGIAYTTSNWLNADFRVGFNISRTFWF